MNKFDRRQFIKLLSQGSAALGMGFSLGGLAACAKEEPSTTAVSESKDTSGKYQIFQPGEYLDWEKEIIDKNLDLAAKSPPKGRSGPEVIIEYPLLKFNNKWDPYNTLFNDKGYAQKAGYQDVPAFPCFTTPRGAGVESPAIPQDHVDCWYYANGPNDVYFFTPIYPGDSLYTETEKIMFEDITAPGSTVRIFKYGTVASMYNQNGDLVARGTHYVRDGYRKIIDGSPAPSFSEVNSEWQDYFPPAHYTTDEEWEYIKELWSKEYIRGKDTLYWEDVNIGDEPTWVCSGPVSYQDMAIWYEGNHATMLASREAIMKGATHNLFRDRFGNYLSSTATMYGGRNVPGFRAIFFNDTGAKFITRMLTNYISDAGFVTRIGWEFFQLYKEMRYPREGGEHLDKVPYMKGKACTHHGSEGDTVIAKGYVTDKYVNDRGEHIIELVCWGETLDNRIIQVVPAAAKLPSRQV